MINNREILQELFYEKTRTILTVIAIAFGTFSIAIMLAVGEGLRLNFARTMENAGNRLLAVNSGVTSKNYRGMGANEPLKFTKRDALAISALPNVSGVTVQYNFDSKFHYRDKESYASFRAVAPEYATIHNIKVGSRQRFFSFLDMQKRNAVVVIGSDSANKLFAPEENPIGNTIYIANHPFVIIGVMQKKPQMSGADTPDAWLNWIPATTYELLNNPQQIDLIAVSYKDFKVLAQTKNNIQKVIAINHGADPGDKSIVDFSDLAEDQAKVNKFFVNMQIFLGVIGGLTLLLAGIGIANVMYAAVKRSTRQIGIRMALGATTTHIVTRYLAESLVATIIGGMIGMIMAMIFVYLARLIPMRGMMFDIFGKPEPVLSFLVLMVVIIVLGIIGFMAGLFPALKAAKIDPAEALIYE